MEKDIRYTDKKVDHAWKSSVCLDQPRVSSKKAREATPEVPFNFSSFITSLAVQALMSMGELAPPESEKPSVNLDAARQTIELLVMLREKTKGNLENQERELLHQLLADLQMKFVAHTSAQPGA